MIAEELAKDPAVQMADTVLLTVPNQLGVEYCATMLDDDRESDRAGIRLVARGKSRARCRFIQ